MKVAIMSTLLYEVPEQPAEQIARDLRRANTLAIGTPMRMAGGQVITLLGVVSLDVVDVDDPRKSYTCPRCSRTSYNPHDVQQRYCGACHQFFDS